MGILSDTVNESKKNCGCGKDPCETYGKKTEEVISEDMVDDLKAKIDKLAKKPNKTQAEKDELDKLEDRMADISADLDESINEAPYQYDMSDKGDMHDALGDVQNTIADSMQQLKKAAGITSQVYDAVEKTLYTDESVKKDESYSPGDEMEDGMVSNCCGAPIMDVYDGHGRCSDCKEMASAEKEEAYYENAEIQRLKDLIRY